MGGVAHSQYHNARNTQQQVQDDHERTRQGELDTSVSGAHSQAYHRQHMNVSTQSHHSVQQIAPYESTVGVNSKEAVSSPYVHGCQVPQKYTCMPGDGTYFQTIQNQAVAKEKKLPVPSGQTTMQNVIKKVSIPADISPLTTRDDIKMDRVSKNDVMSDQHVSIRREVHPKSEHLVPSKSYNTNELVYHARRPEVATHRPEVAIHRDYPTNNDFNRMADFPVSTPDYSQKPVFAVRPNRVESSGFEKIDTEKQTMILPNYSSTSDTNAVQSDHKFKTTTTNIKHQYGVEATPLSIQTKLPVRDENHNFPDSEKFLRDISFSQRFHPNNEPIKSFSSFPSPPESGSKTDTVPSDMDYMELEEDFDQQSYSSEDCMRGLEEEDGDVTLWKCGQCGKTFTQRALLQIHICPRCPDKPYHCGHCDQSFSQPNELRTHVVTHTHERPFKCGFCGRSFAGATTLNNHIRTHTGEKPFCCEKCGKSFTQASQLSRHQRMIGDCIG